MKSLITTSNNKYNKLCYLLLSLLIFLFSLGAWVIIVLNLTPIYRFCIYKFSLISYTGLSKENLMYEFKTLITYLQIPWIHTLQFSIFPMSLEGKIHFRDVKYIFLSIYGILIIVLLLSSIMLFMIKRQKKELSNYLKSLNYFFYTVVVFIALLTPMLFLDFSMAFEKFHKLIFTNSYWIFDPITDPIINALPEELFMLYGALILGGLLLQSIIFKIIYISFNKDHSTN